MSVFKKLKYYLLLKAYVRIECNGPSVIDRIENLPCFFDGYSDSEDIAQYKFSIVWMTEHQYDKLPEFDGF